MLRHGNQKKERDNAKEDDDKARDQEGPAPWSLVITLGPEGRDDGAQDVAHGCVGVPDSHDQTSTEEEERRTCYCIVDMHTFNCDPL